MPELSQFLADWGYLAIAMVVVLGNVGLPVPEETVLILAGYLVSDGHLRLVPTLLVGILSAAAGDNVGYWIGRVYGRRAISRGAQWAHISPAGLGAMQRIVARYGVIAVVVARFVTGLRFLGGPLAGAAGLRAIPFTLANLLGATLFVPYAVGLGYGIGSGVAEYATRVHGVLSPAEQAVLVGSAILVLIAASRWGLRAIRAHARLACAPAHPRPRMPVDLRPGSHESREDAGREQRLDGPDPDR